jgi:dienelactone hydrolase
MNTVGDPVSFPNKDGVLLSGILHAPARPSRSAVILLSPGMKSRVAPHRLYNRMAAAFAADGYYVLRFDFHGLGDSDGTLGLARVAELYGSIQLGRYVPDTLAAVEFLRRTCGVDRIVAGGLCGGAITGLLAASTSADVHGLLGLGLPVVLDTPGADKYRFMTHGQLNRLRSRYFRKLLDVRAWLRLLTFRSEFRLLLKSLKAKRAPKPAAVDPASPGAPTDNTNPLFAPAFLGMAASRRPMLLVFSEMDRLWWEFEEKFLNRHREQLAQHDSGVDILMIKGANHVFTLEAWQIELIDHSRQWLARHFPVAPAAVGVRIPGDALEGAVAVPHK